MFETLWYEKYRPKTLEDLVLTPELRKEIEKFKELNEIPHLLLVGEAGIGKSSTAKVIAREVLDCEYLCINASDEGGIETVRTKVKDFATSASLDDQIKVIIFGEADGLSSSAMDSLKELIEDAAATTRFMFTANDITKLTKPIISRCSRLDIKYSQKAYVKACAEIYIKEGISFKDNTTAFKNMLLSNYPDFRLSITDMQNNHEDGVFVPPTDNASTFVGEVWKHITKEPPESVRELCIQNVTRFGTHAELMVDMIKFAYKHFKVDNTRKFSLVLNKYLETDHNHINKEIHFYCCMIELKQAITS